MINSPQVNNETINHKPIPCLSSLVQESGSVEHSSLPSSLGMKDPSHITDSLSLPFTSYLNNNNKQTQTQNSSQRTRRERAQKMELENIFFFFFFSFSLFLFFFLGLFILFIFPHKSPFKVTEP